MKKAFTLVELLIVVLLISIVYGIYFFTETNRNDTKKFSLFHAKEFMNLKAKRYGNKLTLICDNDSMSCYLLNNKKEILEKFKLDQKVKTFLLKKDEILEPTEYKNIELSDTIYFQPSIIFKKLTKTKFETLIYYNSDNKWVYISPYFNDTKEFINKEEIISYIKKKTYLPMYAGLAE